jgi:Holliday junction resolvase RusA-like endonuclease
MIHLECRNIPIVPYKVAAKCRRCHCLDLCYWNHNNQSKIALKRALYDQKEKAPLISGPVKLDAIIYLPKGMSIDGKPDWDNLGKTVGDVLTGLVWEDDCKVIDARIRKESSQDASWGLSVDVEEI